MRPKCLLISDDLTGGADSGAQFARIGLRTLLISLNESHIDLAQYGGRDALVIDTESRGLRPEQAFQKVSEVLRTYNRQLFPVVYKKIDSTLRGNVGYEIDAILETTGISMGFIAPSFPEQKRTLVGGIMMVDGKPLSLTEASRDAVSPVKESHVDKLLENQSRCRIGRIDLTYVASSYEILRRAVEKERSKGNQIIIFDAVQRRDLTHIAQVGFGMEEKPLFIGSAGLAEEVAKQLSSVDMNQIHHPLTQAEPVHHIFLISGSASSVTHQQLKRIEKRMGIASFELSRSLILTEQTTKQKQTKELSLAIAEALSQGHALLKSCSERLVPKGPNDPPVHLQITEMLGQIALQAIERSEVDRNHLALIIVGGETARSVFNALKFKGLEIVGEIMEGVILSYLIDGNRSGLKVITKAGAFGKENVLKRIIEILETGSSSSK